MKPETAFDIGFQAYSVHQLLPEDSEAIQGLFEKCLDYMLLVDGRPANPHSAEEEFQDVPPGKSYNDKYVYGIINQQNDLVGLLDGLRGYPDEFTWWIGLLILVPEVRSHGIGEKIVQGFAEFVQTSGDRAIMLGVVDENTLAHKFWARMGFEPVYRTEPRQYGNKTHAVSILRWTLPASK
jgi:GNAT superfamily N-acetyltransferase